MKASLSDGGTESEPYWMMLIMPMKLTEEQIVIKKAGNYLLT